jgi:membrane-bound hydrogenase subunit alpha
VDPCYCCTERLAVVIDLHTGDKIMNGNDMIRLSAQKTNALKL